MSFPAGFIWGAASASYQIEGAANDDGKGLSVWDVMCRKPGAIWCNQNGDVACNHYNLYKKDIALMKTLGLMSYRFSISWPRVFPNGIGAVNKKGLDFYSRIVDELLEKGIIPFVTLFHWDYPYELYCKGGWLNSQSPNWFSKYVETVVRVLGDRVEYWLTMNEPQCFIGLGHLEGKHAPGDKLGNAEVLRAGHNALLAHGKAVQIIRGCSKRKANIGFAPAGVVKIPVNNHQKDIDAARNLMFSIRTKQYWNNTWWMDPVYLGKYPEDGLKMYEDELPPFSSEDLSIISQPLDFFGVNIYQGEKVFVNQDGIPDEIANNSDHRFTAFDWPVSPECLYWGPKFFYERYKKPIFITENGMANIDWVMLDNRVHDPQRIDFLARYFREMKRAIADNIDIRAYFHWSLTDNFEWAEGFKKRFGLIYVDYNSQTRIIKDSGFWYQNVIKSNGVDLGFSSI